MKLKTAVIAIAAVMLLGPAVAQNATNQTNTTNDTNDTNVTVPENETAQQLERVIVATDANYPDSAISDPASEKLGVPVLLTSPEELEDSTASILEDYEVEQAVIVGGPAVVSEDVEDEINGITENDSIRLWGETAGETSVDVSRYFWPEDIEEATVVQTALTEGEEGYKDSHRLLTAAVNNAEGPVFVSDTGEMSEEVLSELDRRNIGQVTVYSTNGTDVEGTFEDSDISANINEGSVEELTSELYTDLQDNADNRTLFAVNGSDFKYSIPAYSYPNSAIYALSGDNTSEDIEFINESDYSQVMFAGPSQDQEIQQNLNNPEINTGFIEINNSSEASAELLDSTSNVWINAQNELFTDWASNFEEGGEAEDSVEENLELAQDAVELSESSEGTQLLEQAETDIEDGKLWQAHLNTFRALSAAETTELESQANQTEGAENETLSETSNETANESTEGPSLANDTENETDTDNETNESVSPSAEDAENATENETANETETGTESENDTSSENQTVEVGDSRVNITASANTITANATYTAPTTGYTEMQNVTQNGSEIIFVFDLSSPEGMAGQAVTTYGLEEEIDVEDGIYTAEAILRVDNETVNETESEINVTAEA